MLIQVTKTGREGIWNLQLGNLIMEEEILADDDFIKELHALKAEK